VDFRGFEGAVRALKIHNIWHTVAGLFGGALEGGVALRVLHG